MLVLGLEIRTPHRDSRSCLLRRKIPWTYRIFNIIWIKFSVFITCRDEDTAMEWFRLTLLYLLRCDMTDIHHNFYSIKRCIKSRLTSRIFMRHSNITCCDWDPEVVSFIGKYLASSWTQLRHWNSAEHFSSGENFILNRLDSFCTIKDKEIEYICYTVTNERKKKSRCHTEVWISKSIINWTYTNNVYPNQASYNGNI